MIYEKRFRPDGYQFDPWIEGQWVKVANLLDAFEGPWAQDLDNHFNIAQANLACALGFIDFKHAERGWRDTRPNLVSWFDAISLRPSLVATVPR